LPADDIGLAGRAGTVGHDRIDAVNTGSVERVSASLPRLDSNCHSAVRRILNDGREDLSGRFDVIAAGTVNADDDIGVLGERVRSVVQRWNFVERVVLD
jgi:hypothetical protein